MKKLLLALCAALGCVSFGFANGATLYVDATASSEAPDGTESRPYTTLQAALTAVTSPTTTTIKVLSGTYDAFVIVEGNSGITIEGVADTNGNKPVIKTCYEGSPTWVHTLDSKYNKVGCGGIDVYATDVTLKNLKIADDGVATQWFASSIGFYYESNNPPDRLTVDGCDFVGSGKSVAIYLHKGTITLTNNTFTGYDLAYGCWGDASSLNAVTVTGNTFKDVKTAVNVYYGKALSQDAAGVVVTGNTFQGDCVVELIDQMQEKGKAEIALKATVTNNSGDGLQVNFVHIDEFADNEITCDAPNVAIYQFVPLTLNEGVSVAYTDRNGKVATIDKKGNILLPVGQPVELTFTNADGTVTVPATLQAADPTTNTRPALKDGSNADFVVPAIPSNSAFVSNNNGVVTIWGETRNADPVSDLQIEMLTADGAIMGSVKLNDVDGIYAATTSDLTWHMMVLGEETDAYWTTTWQEGYPSKDAQPAKARLYIDGALVNECRVHMSAPDDLKPVVWTKLFVAEVSGTIYGSIQAALDAAGQDDTVTLLCDTAFKAEDDKPETQAWVKEGKTVTVDLNGKTVEGAFFINGTATLKNGAIVNKDCVSGVETKGNLTLEDMTITSDRHAVRVAAGTVLIKSGVYTTTADSSTSGYAMNIKGDSEIVVTVEGGEFYGSATASVTGKSAVTVQKADNKIVITGGKFVSGATAGTAYSVENYSPKSTISGGEFAGSLVNGYKNITGGKFTVDPSAQVVDGYMAELQDDGLYKVVEITNWIQLAETSWYNDTDKTFTLATEKQLAGLAQLVNEGNTFSGKTITLGADLGLGKYEWTPIGGTNKFLGTFDGQNHVLSNLLVTSTTSNVGFIGNAYGCKEIKNLTIKNAEVKGKSYVGVIVGNLVGNVSNCHVTGSIKLTATDRYVGCIAGWGYMKVDNCSAIASPEVGVIKGIYAGGIVGFLAEGDNRVENCRVENIFIDSYAGAGSIVGMAHYGVTIAANTSKDVTIETTYHSTDFTGLVAGQNGGGTQTSYVINNKVENVSAKDYDTVITHSAPPTSNTVVGTGVTFDESGKKVTGGTFECEPAKGALADGALALPNDNGTYTVLIPVAKIEEGDAIQYFTKLSDAVKAANAATTALTITLMKDISDSSCLTIKAGKTVVLDLGGYIWTSTGGMTGFGPLTNKGDLTIQNGAIISTTQGGNIGTVTNSGTLTIAATATLKRSHASANISFYALKNTAGTATVYGVLESDGNGISAGGTVFVEDGAQITTQWYGIDVVSGGTATINGGEILGSTSAVQVTKGSLIVTGGKLDVQGDNKSYLVNCKDEAYDDGSATVSISGGTFVGFDPYQNAAEGQETNFCAVGYISEPSEDEATGATVYGVKAGYYDVRIDDANYETLADAIAAVPQGSTATIYVVRPTNFRWPEALIIPEGVTIELADGVTVDPPRGYAWDAANTLQVAVCEIGTTGYLTLAEALTVAKKAEPVATVKILSGDYTTTTLTFGGDGEGALPSPAVIDFNGFTVGNITVTAGATLTIEGELVLPEGGVLKNEGTTINNGTITGPDVDGAFAMINDEATDSVFTNNGHLNGNLTLTSKEIAGGGVTVEGKVVNSINSGNVLNQENEDGGPTVSFDPGDDTTPPTLTLRDATLEVAGVTVERIDDLVILIDGQNDIALPEDASNEIGIQTEGTLTLQIQAGGSLTVTGSVAAIQAKQIRVEGVEETPYVLSDGAGHPVELSADQATFVTKQTNSLKAKMMKAPAETAATTVAIETPESLFPSVTLDWTKEASGYTGTYLGQLKITTSDLFVKEGLTALSFNFADRTDSIGQTVRLYHSYTGYGQLLEEIGGSPMQRSVNLSPDALTPAQSTTYGVRDMNNPVSPKADKDSPDFDLELYLPKRHEITAADVCSLVAQIKFTYVEQEFCLDTTSGRQGESAAVFMMWRATTAPVSPESVNLAMALNRPIQPDLSAAVRILDFGVTEGFAEGTVALSAWSNGQETEVEQVGNNAEVIVLGTPTLDGDWEQVGRIALQPNDRSFKVPVAQGSRFFKAYLKVNQVVR